MIDIGLITKTTPALSRRALGEAYSNVRPAYSRATVERINLGKSVYVPQPQATPERASAPQRPAATQPQARPVRPAPTLRRPELQRPVQRGQKTPLGIRQGAGDKLQIGFGWNVKDGRCDVDASAFLLGADGKVPSDDWFVFYGQPESPDGAVRIGPQGGGDRQALSVDLNRLSPQIQRVVFVMTINEALENHLNFGMIADAWLRVLDGAGRELVSYSPAELYENITSMTLGELYLRNGEWRFNPVGNGMDTDLAGQCAVYGVNISD